MKTRINSARRSPLVWALLGTTLVGCKTAGSAAPASQATPVAAAPVAPAGKVGSPDSTDTSRAPRPQSQTSQRAGSASQQRPQGPQAPGPRPYAQVITKAAVTKKGVFNTHLISGKLFIEIPRSELNKDFLMVGRFVKTAPMGGGQDGPYAGDRFLSRALRFERRENSVFLSSPSYQTMADSSSPIAAAVDAASLAPIIAALPVAAYGADSSIVLDVTSLFVANPLFSSVGRGFTLDANRSFINRAAAFPENIIIEATQTGANQTGARTSVGLWSLIKLPEKPMMPRLADDRVGYFSVSRLDFGTNEHRVVRQRYITRWRLEKKDPSAELSEPVQPIVYYVDPNTPDQWKPFVRAGIEAWQVAFEAAGFKNAIVARDVPTDDPDWSMEDNRNTVIRWLPSPVENAQGPHVNDPRTGEILNGSVRMFHNILNLQRSWYFTQVAPLDPRAQTFPFPDSLMGKLLQYVVEHEIGHTLGFPHNHKASSTYPFDSLRSVSWLKKMGHIPSLMDYARFNYIAQPEDRIPVDLLIPKVGPYDKFATMWGYKPIPGAATPEDELPTLNSWARMQDTIPWYRFGRGAESGFNGNPDFGDAREAIGDIDPVRASTLGLKNIRRIVPMLLGTTVTPGKSYADLSEIYDRLLNQWRMEMSHVVNIVGGYETQTKFGDQEGTVYSPLPRARQVEAMNFLAENVWKTPEFLIVPEVNSLILPEGSGRKLESIQAAILSLLFNFNRISRMLAVESGELQAHGNSVYTVADLLSDLRSGIWTELSSDNVGSIDLFRRALQRQHIARINNILNPPPPPPVAPGAQPRPPAPTPPREFVAQLKESLRVIRRDATRGLGSTQDFGTRAHLNYVVDEIDRILDIK